MYGFLILAVVDGAGQHPQRAASVSFTLETLVGYPARIPVEPSRI
jgi:hypothetical protein